MYNFPNLSELSLEDCISKGIIALIRSENYKLTLEIENMKKSQNLVNDSNKGEHKTISSEVEQLKNQIIAYQTKLASQGSKLSILEKEVAVFRTPNWNIQNNNEFVEIKSARNKTKLDSGTNLSEIQYPETSAVNETISNGKLEDSLNFMISVKLFENTVNTAKNVSQVQEQFLSFKKEILEIFSQKDKIIESLLVNNKNLEECNSQLKSQVMAYEEENSKGKFCIHCHKMFVPKFNEERSCVYHSGKLKYYSCRGCGGDEYYTCCMKCSKCSNGCKTGKHIASI